MVADGRPELLCELHLAALPQKLSSEKYNEPPASEQDGKLYFSDDSFWGECGQVGRKGAEA